MFHSEKPKIMFEKCYKIENNIRVFEFPICLHYLNHLGKKRYGQSFQLSKEDRDTLFKLISYSVGAVEDCKVLIPEKEFCC